MTLGRILTGYLQRFGCAAVLTLPLCGPAAAELPRYEKIIEAFDRTALSAPGSKAGSLRKWAEPLRYRIEGMRYDKERIALSVAALEKTAALAGLAVAAAEPGERENFLLRFDNVAHFVLPGFGKASCVAYSRWSEERSYSLYHVRLDINLAADPDISRCINHEALHGLGLLGHPDGVDSVLNYSTRNHVEPSELDILLIRLLYHPEMKSGMGRLAALTTAYRLLQTWHPKGAELPTAYLDGVVKQLQTAANQGSTAAQKQLAQAYREGHYVAVDAAAADRWEAMATPPRLLAEGKVPMDDYRFVPFNISSSGYENLRTFLSRESRPRAFAIASSGSWGWSAGRSNAEERALANCQQYTKANCTLYIRDDELVWTPSGQGPYADEAMDWGVIAQEKYQPADKLHAPTPVRHPRVPVISTDALKAMMATEMKPILLDVHYGLWSLPGAYRIGAWDAVELTESQLVRLRDSVEALRDVDPNRPIVVFCSNAYCWMSYNAALRMTELNMKNIHWYRGGLAAWRAAGQDVDVPNMVDAF